MARRKSPSASSTSNTSEGGRVRLLFVEMEGNDDTLQASIKAFTQAMSKTTVVRRLAADGGAPPVDGDDDMLETGDDDADVVDVEAGSDDATNSPEPRRRRGEGPKRDRNTGIKLNPELDLSPDGTTSLASFVEAKGPGSQQAEIAVFVYWLKETAGLSKATLDDVFTCFKKTGRKLPKDLRQSIRNAEKTQGWVTGDLQDLQISTSGQNYVGHDLPISSGGDDGQ